MTSTGVGAEILSYAPRSLVAQDMQRVGDDDTEGARRDKPPGAGSYLSTCSPLQRVNLSSPFRTGALGVGEAVGDGEGPEAPGPAGGPGEAEAPEPASGPGEAGADALGAVPPPVVDEAAGAGPEPAGFGPPPPRLTAK